MAWLSLIGKETVLHHMVTKVITKTVCVIVQNDKSDPKNLGKTDSFLENRTAEGWSLK